MAKIIADGTCNGWNIFPKKTSFLAGEEITDIRSVFEKGQKFLSVKPGYLIRPVKKGVWVSIVKLMIDGERSGGGNGYMSFSVFLSANESLASGVLKQSLDGLMRHYLTKCTDGVQTCAIRVDWSFIQKYENDISAEVKNGDPITFPLKQKDDVAVVDLSKYPIDKYLDNPFQSEYFSYKLVVLSPDLLDKDVLSKCNRISIDFDDIEYAIEYSTSEDVTFDESRLSKVRKNEIDGKTIKLYRKYYETQEIRLSDCKRNDQAKRLTVCECKWKEKKYTLKVLYGCENRNISNEEFSFEGKNVEKTFPIPLPKGLFMPCEKKITPSDYLDKGMVYEFDIIPAKKIKIRINLDGKDATEGLINNLKISKGNYFYSDKSNKEDILVPEDSKISDYEFEISNDNFECKGEEQNSEWIITVSSKVSRKPTRKVDDNKNLQGCNTVYNSTDGVETSHNTNFSNGNEGQQDASNEQIQTKDNRCVVFFNKYKRLLLIGCFALLLSGCGIGLYFLINKPNESIIAECEETQSGVDSIREMILDSLVGNTTRGEEQTLPETLVVELSNPVADPSRGEKKQAKKTENDEFNEQYQILKDDFDIQVKKWNYTNLNLICDGYGQDKSISLQQNNPKAFEMLQRLRWLRDTRKLINNKNWNRLTDYYTDKTANPKWRDLDDESKESLKELAEFIKELATNANNASDCVNDFKNKCSTIYNLKNFQQLKELWDKAKNNKCDDYVGDEYYRM